MPKCSATPVQPRDELYHSDLCWAWARAIDRRGVYVCTALVHEAFVCSHALSVDFVAIPSQRALKWFSTSQAPGSVTMHLATERGHALYL